uniref:Uncharacterized protein n=1 Tax=Rhizophora mucronata TaxID=61149 RepID=A0A2P2PAI8_RHIMU
MCAFLLLSAKMVFVLMCLFGPRLCRFVSMFVCFVFFFFFFLGQTVDKSKSAIIFSL